MRKSSRALILSLGLTISGFFAGAASAQEQTMTHPDLRGIWGLAGCADTNTGFLVIHGTMTFLLEGANATSQALTATSGPAQGGWVAARLDADPLFLRRVTGTPDILEVAVPVGDRAGAAPDAVPDPSRWNVNRATSCAALPPGPQALYGEVFAVLRGIDAAQPACAEGPQRCAAAIFSVADVNPDGALNTAEISRIIRVLVQLGAIEQGNGGADAQAGMFAISVPLAPVLARALISSFDYNGDDGLSLGEILGDRFVLPSSDMAQILSGAESQVSEMMNTLQTRASDLGRLLMMMR
jgi:hypothetical protein